MGQGVLSRADGSGQARAGETEVLAAVYGPTEVKIRDEKLDRATLEVKWKPIIGPPGIVETSYERFLRESLDSAVITSLHPRTLISITIQVINDDGSILSCAFNAALLALLDAGIPLHYVPVSLTVSVHEMSDENGELHIPNNEGKLTYLVDPTTDEAKSVTCASNHVFVFDQRDNNEPSQENKGLERVSANESTGTFTLGVWTSAANMVGGAGADTIRQLIRSCVHGKLAKERGDV